MGWKPTVGAPVSHTHVESEVTDLDHWVEADHDALDHTGLTGVGGAIDDLTDVTITTPADNEVVAYDTGTAEFINQTAAEAGLSATGHAHTESDISDLGTYSETGHTHVEADVTDLDHFAEADHDALDHSGLTGVGGGELLMQDGVTSPPVPIENEAGDDWLYED